MSFNQKDFDGTILAARYAFMPNKLNYCGGDSNNELFECVIQDRGDGELGELLREFQTMHPYLRLIAGANKIVDPFNYQVVEAYWIGNNLLESVSMENFYRYLVDEQKLKKKLRPELAEKVFGKIPVGAKPHHSFHVFNIPKRTGHYPVEHSLGTMDECRISPARIKTLPVPSEARELKALNKMIVEYQPLIVMGNKVEIGEMAEKEVFCEMDKKAFVKEPKIGDWVSLHWSWVCDFLSKEQVENLNKWTKYNLALANIDYA
jgi:hypothetical protein